MAELTLLVNSTDTALLAGSAVSPAASSGAGGGFASVLGGQLRPGAGAVAMESSPSGLNVAASAVTESGDASPLTGKPLPVTTVPVVPPVPAVEPQTLGATLLSAIAQGLPSGSVASANTPLAGAQPIVSETSLPSAFLQRALAQSVTDNNSPPRAANNIATPDALLTAQTNQANLQQTARLVSPVLVDVQQQAQQLASAPAVLSVLGKPISEVARQNLAQLGQNAGSAKSLRADMTTTVAGTLLSNGQSLGVANSAPGMNAATRLDVLTNAMNNAVQTEAATELRLAIQPALNSSALADESINTQFGVTRLNATPLTGAVPTLPVATPLAQPTWANELGQRITWLANNELREAKLQLNPRNLGTVDVRIVYGPDQQLSVSFSAANPIARDALDASLPRLREMLEQQGLQLADANVSRESPEEREQRKAMFDAGNAHDEMRLSDDESDAMLAMNVSAAQWIGEGMLDAYA